MKYSLNIADSFCRVNPNNENPSQFREGLSEARFVSGCLFYALRRRRTAITASSRASTPAAAISRILGYRDKKTIHKYVDPLLASGCLARTVPDRPSSRNQKYITARFS